MKKLWIALMLLTALLPGCSQKPSPEEIAKVAYEWEKAYFDRDYDSQQQLIYEEGSHEVDKTAKKIDSGLKYEDIQYEIYEDKDSKEYYVFATFKNPNGENTVRDKLLLRQKADSWKIDVKKSLDLNKEDIQTKFERQACIHCDQ